MVKLLICDVDGVLSDGKIYMGNQGEELNFEQELAQDVLEIITIFSARLYGSRSKKNQQLIEAVKKAL